MAESSLKSHAAFVVDRAAYDVTVRATDDVEVVPKGAPSLYPPLFTLELTVNVGVEGVDDGIDYKVAPQAYADAVGAVYERAVGSVQGIPQVLRLLL